jgi:hypothetical protein
LRALPNFPQRSLRTRTRSLIFHAWVAVPLRPGPFDSSLTPQCSIFSSGKGLTHQPGGVALCAASSPGVVGATCWTVGGKATPTAWKTLPHVPWASLRNRNRFPSCSTSTTCKAVRCLEGFDGFVTSAAAPIATGWSDQLSGRESHPLKIRAFPRRTATRTPCYAAALEALQEWMDRGLGKEG